MWGKICKQQPALFAEGCVGWKKGSSYAKHGKTKLQHCKALFWVLVCATLASAVQKFSVLKEKIFWCKTRLKQPIYIKNSEVPNNSIVLQKVTLIEYTCWVHFVCCRTVQFCAFFGALAQFGSCREDWKDEEMLFSLRANIFKHSPCVQMFSSSVLQHGTTQNAACALHGFATIVKMLI